MASKKAKRGTASTSRVRKVAAGTTKKRAGKPEVVFVKYGLSVGTKGREPVTPKPGLSTPIGSAGAMKPKPDGGRGLSAVKPKPGGGLRIESPRRTSRRKPPGSRNAGTRRSSAESKSTRSLAGAVGPKPGTGLGVGSREPVIPKVGLGVGPKRREPVEPKTSGGLGILAPRNGRSAPTGSAEPVTSKPAGGRSAATAPYAPVEPKLGRSALPLSAPVDPDEPVEPKPRGLSALAPRPRGGMNR